MTPSTAVLPAFCELDAEPEGQGDRADDAGSAGLPAPVRLTELDGDIALARTVMAASKSAATLGAHASDWASFSAWVERHGLGSPHTVGPEGVVLHLTHLMRRGQKLSSIERALIGVGEGYRAAG